LLRLIPLPTVEDIVVYHRLPTDNDARKVAVQQAGDYLLAVGRRLAQDFAATNVKITWSVEECEDVAGTLIQIAAQGKGVGMYPVCNVVALATHGYNAVQRWIAGSVTERLLEHSSLPLLVIHPQTHAANEDASAHVVALK
jgi:nucleotide-binding universal stress UspA family protein